VILDTNAVSALLDGDSGFESIAKRRAHAAIPIPVVGEYLFGLRSSKLQRSLAADFRQLLRIARVLSADVETAEVYADIRSTLRRVGRPIPENDLWIAPLAVQHDLPLVSRDTHFDAVAGVTRVGW
jgi:predicted nucleic acid-binding protein